MLNAMLFDGGVNLLVFRVHRFQFYFELTNLLRRRTNLPIQCLPLKSQELRLQASLFFLIYPVFFCSLRLTLQMLQLAFQFVTQIR